MIIMAVFVVLLAPTVFWLVWKNSHSGWYRKTEERIEFRIRK